MNDKDIAEIESLVKRYKGHKKVADSQQLMITLWDKPTRTDSDNNLLLKLLRIERQIEKTRKAKREVTKVLNAEKEKARKALTQKKIILGGMLLSGSTNGNHVAECQKMVRRLVEMGLASERDTPKCKEIINELPTPQPSNRELRKRQKINNK